MKRRILLVDDERDMGDVTGAGLRRRGFDTVFVTSADEAWSRLGEEDFDVVVTDLNMKGMSGVDLCQRIAQNRRDVPVIVVTAFGSLDTAIATLRAGAFDFVTKPFDIEQLVLAVERALSQRALREEVKRLRRAVDESKRHDDILGTSPPMRAVFDLIDRVADSDSTVLITGESGTGKELVAQSLHHRSKRQKGPLIAINCAAVPEPLLESELFGYERGAFTGAQGNKRGLFLEADGGTLFLDEVGEMPLGMQAKLLRALETRSVRPVGATAEVPFDARIVAATNRDLQSLVEEKRFREDLYYRIHVVHIELPPLRSRGSDVLLLAQHFLERAASRGEKAVRGLSPSAAEKLLAYDWPGNVRELQNAMERGVAVTRFEEVTVEDLPPRLRDFKSSHVVVASSDPMELASMEEVEKRYIRQVMQAVGWNKTHAARVLKFDRATLYRKLDRYQITPPPADRPSKG